MGTGSPYRTPGPVHTFGAARDTDRRNHREPRPREPPRRRRRRCPLRRRSDRPAAGPCRARRRARRPRPAARRHELHPLPRARRGRPAVPLGAARRGARDGRPRDPLRRPSTSTAPPHRHPCGCPSRTRPASTTCSPRVGTSSTGCSRTRPSGPEPPSWTAPPSTASCVTTAAGSAASPPPRRTGPRCGSRHASWSAPTACGRGSRRSSGAEVVESHAPSGACLYTYVGDQDWDGFEFHLGDHAFGGVFPTHFGEACVWLIRPEHLARPVLSAGADRLEAWTEALESTLPGLAERVREGRVSAPLRGAVRLPNHVRRAAGPGWALVGDAGYHRDPITGTRHDRRLPRRGPARGGRRPRAARPVRGGRRDASTSSGSATGPSRRRSA